MAADIPAESSGQEPIKTNERDLSSAFADAMQPLREQIANALEATQKWPGDRIGSDEQMALIRLNRTAGELATRFLEENCEGRLVTIEHGSMATTGRFRKGNTKFGIVRLEDAFNGTDYKNTQQAEGKVQLDRISRIIIIAKARPQESTERTETGIPEIAELRAQIADALTATKTSDGQQIGSFEKEKVYKLEQKVAGLAVTELQGKFLGKRVLISIGGKAVEGLFDGEIAYGHVRLKDVDASAPNAQMTGNQITAKIRLGDISDIRPVPGE